MAFLAFPARYSLFAPSDLHLSRAAPTEGQRRMGRLDQKIQEIIMFKRTPRHRHGKGSFSSDGGPQFPKRAASAALLRLDLTLDPERQPRRFEVINGAGGRRHWSVDDEARIIAESKPANSMASSPSTISPTYLPGSSTAIRTGRSMTCCLGPTSGDRAKGRGL